MHEFNQLVNVVVIAIIAYAFIRGIMAAFRKRAAPDGTISKRVTATLPSFRRVATRDTFTLILFVPTAFLAFIAACGTTDSRFFSAQHELLLDGSQGLNSPKDEQAWMILSFMYSLSRYPYARRMMLRA